MAASATRRRIDKVLAAARKDLQGQLTVVRAERARLAAEEKELTAAIANLKSDGQSSSPAPSTSKSRRRRSTARGASARKRSTASANGGPTRARRGKSKPTAERVEELRGLLAEGPKSRVDLAAALKVSPARVQQLLAELGSSVSSQPGPDKRAKLWTIKGKSNGSRAAGSRTKAKRGRGKSTTAKQRAGRAAA